MTEVRRLTQHGIEGAQEFLVAWNLDPEGHREPPMELLYDSRYSQLFGGGLEVDQRRFRTRRDAAEYFAPKLSPIKRQIPDDAGLWSWLGMYYFPSIAPLRAASDREIGKESFVFSDDESTTEARRSYQRRYRHYLRAAWSLYDQLGEQAAFLLDEPISSFSDLADRILSNFRIFNSKGVVPLLLRLYTEGDRLKAGYTRSEGGLRHLIRVLDQLERTYDVYGMPPDALLGVLPESFRRWDTSDP